LAAQRKQKAFVLVKVEPGHERDVMDTLFRLDEVKEVHIIPGEWDIIAVVEAEKGIVASGDERVYDIVLDKIEKTKHVQDTNTLVSHFAKSK
jgi:DNA-binding Lrp family transcriptional regulator